VKSEGLDCAHDLLGNVINAVGAKVEKIVITDLKLHTYFAEIYINFNGDIKVIDSRPSDAIALSALVDAPIFVDEIVFEKAII